MRLESGLDANKTTLINSKFAGNSVSADGITRQDTSVELAITRRSPVALVIRRNTRSSVAHSGVDVGTETQFVVEVKGPAKAPSPASL